jgi:hypothetical protein
MATETDVLPLRCYFQPLPKDLHVEMAVPVAVLWSKWLYNDRANNDNCWTQ